MKTSVVNGYELEEARKELKDYMIEYIEMCARNRVALIRNGDINEVLLAIKGEIAMAAMEGRIDLSRELSERFEELACIEVDLQRLHERQVDDNYLKR
jgi:hypothetical protein